MTSTEDSPSGTVSPRDAVRIVPLHLPPSLVRPLVAVEPARPAHLTYRGGPLLTAVEVLTVYWGTGWQSQPLADTADRLDAFFDTVLAGPVVDQLAEYSVAGQQIGHGRRVGRAVVTTPQPGAVVTDAEIQDMLQQHLGTDPAFPPVGPNSLHFVYLPPGTAVAAGGTRSCQGFCGYHDAFNGNVFYAVMPYPGCQGCTGTLAEFDALTSVSSHELCEAVTDPVPGQGWYDNVNGEIGDICAWQTRVVDGYTVQLEWSNTSGSCV